MKITNSAFFPETSLSETVFPAVSGNEKLGAGVPSGNMVLAVRTMSKPLKKDEMLVNANSGEGVTLLGDLVKQAARASHRMIAAIDVENLTGNAVT